MDADEAYDVLDLSRDASDEEIKNAYRRLTKEYHPDASDGDTRERWIRIREAKETLLTNERSGGQTSGTDGATRDTKTRETTSTDTTGSARTEDSGTESTKTAGTGRERGYERDHRRRESRTETGQSSDAATGRDTRSGDHQTGKTDRERESVESVGSFGLAIGFVLLLFELIWQAVKTLGIYILSIGFVTNQISWAVQTVLVLAILIEGTMVSIPDTFFNIISFFAIVYLSAGGAVAVGIAAVGILLESDMFSAAVMAAISALLAGYYFYSTKIIGRVPRRLIPRVMPSEGYLLNVNRVYWCVTTRNNLSK